MKHLLMTAFLACASTTSLGAQWLNLPTPGIPRTADGKPNLEAPAPRQTAGHPDLSGIWVGRNIVMPVPEDALSPNSKELLRERRDNYFKDRPANRCRPSGPEPHTAWKPIVHMSALLYIFHARIT